MNKPMLPAQQKARVYLTTIIEQYHAAKRCRLPGIRNLANRANVSIVTMSIVVASMESEGYITAIPGSGLFITSLYNTEKPIRITGNKEYKWQHFMSDFKDALRKGAYVPGSVLPPIKTLGQQHGMCYRTIKKALHELVKEKALEPYKKTFRIPSIQVHYGNALVILVAYGSNEDVLSLVTPRTQENLRTLELECSRCKLKLMKVTCDKEGSFLRKPYSAMKMIEEQKRTNTIVGFIVWSIGIDVSGIRKIEQQLSKFSTPIAILDEKAMLDENCRSYHRSTLFSMASGSLSGSRVGSYLAEYGHKRIAYLSPFHEPQWSKNRLAGIQKEIVNKNASNEIVPYVLNMPALHVENENTEKYIDGFLKKLKQDRGNDSFLIKTISESRNRLRDAMHREYLLHRLRPLFYNVIQQPSITALVAGNDMIALALWELLIEKGKQVPRDISIIGFDDSVDAHIWGLTSYNFNASSVMRAMLVYLLDSNVSNAKKKGEMFWEVEGFIVERRSVRKIS